MNWVPILQFAYGFFQGIAQSRAERAAQQSHALQPRGYNFAEHMQMLDQQSAYSLVNLERKVARFEARFAGRAYCVSVFYLGDTIQITVWSHIRFPNGIPQEVTRFAAQQNREQENCDFDTMEVNGEELLYSRFRARTDRLTPQAFDTVVGRIGSLMAALDLLLVKNGFTD